MADYLCGQQSEVTESIAEADQISYVLNYQSQFGVIAW